MGETPEYPISLYYDTEPSDRQVLDLSRGGDDYRKVYVVDDGKRKLVIKRFSNTFSDKRRITGWFRLMDAYREAGIYCPSVVPNLRGELIHCDLIDGRHYYTYAEEFSIYKTAEQIEKENYEDAWGNYRFTPEVMRLLGKIGAARLDILDWPSAYCLLEPFCAPDTTDEATECAIKFTEYVKEHIPRHASRGQMLLEMFFARQNEVKSIYGSLPTSCFQGDLGRGNILLDEDNHFAGLIDFNLCGKEPVLNYAVREALWGISDHRLFGENGRRLYFYSKELDDLRLSLFLANIRYIQAYYPFDDVERDAFPVLLRYINSFWWCHLDEVKLIQEDDQKIGQLFDWLEYQMTRNDIQLP